MTNFSHLEKWFDDDVSRDLLNLGVEQPVSERSIIAKSMYNFDLDSQDGLYRLIELLPIMDPAIINEVYQEIFPGYPIDSLAERMSRLELKGYLMDYLAEMGALPGA
jgi:hypothetical protein